MSVSHISLLLRTICYFFPLQMTWEVFMKSQVDPDEYRKILAREKKASAEHFSSTLKRHTLILQKRDIMRKKADEEMKKTIGHLLAAEGLELDDSEEEL